MRDTCRAQSLESIQLNCHQLASAKRTAKERTGVHSWHPYYGGYSEAFVETALKYVGADSNSVVLDPWAGSGTTAHVAAKSGIQTISIEINPAMLCFAAAKSPCVSAHADQLSTFFTLIEEALDAELAGPTPERTDGLGVLFGASTANLFRAYLRVADSLGACGFATARGTGRLNPVDPISCFAKAVALCIVRQHVPVSTSSNPTWSARFEAGRRLSARRFVGEITETMHRMLDDLLDYYGGHPGTVRPLYTLGDSRSLPLDAESIDAVISSPPYLTRLDYAVSTTPELLSLGAQSDLTLLRYRTMGSTVIRPGLSNGDIVSSPTCASFLAQVSQHQSKAARSYYLKNFHQYFVDAEAVIRELYRVARPGASCLLVLQNSYFKEIECKLSDIYVEMASFLGFDATIVRREPVRVILANTNSRSSRHAAVKQYSEDVVLFRKG